MSANNIKSKMISFTEEYHGEYNFLKKQGNASRLVCELVRQYMKAGGGNTGALIIPMTKNNGNKPESNYSNEMIDSAKDLL